MRAGSSTLRRRIAVAFAGTALVLYAATALSIFVIVRGSSDREIALTLYAEAESLEGYYLATERLDFPELDALDVDAPFPIWLRVIDHGRVQAATPGLPDLPVATDPKDDTRLQEVAGAGTESFVAVRHQVTDHPAIWVEALTRSELRGLSLSFLAAALALTPLLLVPLTALAGKLLVDHSLRPLDRLMHSIRTIESDNLSQRLEASGAAAEIAELTDEFNSLLERLEASFERLKRFAADASHELRTPIAILRTRIEVALSRDRSPEEYHAALAESLLDTQRMHRVVETLLAMARDPSGLETRQTPVDLSDVVKTAAASMTPVATARGVTITSQVEDDLSVLGNKSLLHAMVLDLLDNAVNHAPAESAVTIRLSREGDSARLTVADRGRGVPVQDRGHIFERYFRGGEGPIPEGAGGLGLNLVARTAHSHGGDVALVEPEDGHGAVFLVHLPLLHASDQP